MLANGVGITRNPFRNDYPAHFLNVQVSGHAVTDGQGTPEQLLVYDEGKPVCEIVSRSSLNGGKVIDWIFGVENQFGMRGNVRK